MDASLTFSVDVFSPFLPQLNLSWNHKNSFSVFDRILAKNSRKSWSKRNGLKLQKNILKKFARKWACQSSKWATNSVHNLFSF